MLYKYKPNYFLATLGSSIEFDANGEFNTTSKGQDIIMEEIGAVKVSVKKTKK